MKFPRLTLRLFVTAALVAALMPAPKPLSAEGFTPLSGISRYHCFRINGDTTLFRITTNGYDEASFTAAKKEIQKSFRGNNKIIKNLKRARKGASKKKKRKLQRAIKTRTDRRRILSQELTNLDNCQRKIALPDMSISGSVKIYPGKRSDEIIAASFFTMDIPKIRIGKGQFLDTGDGSRWCVTIESDDDVGSFAPPYGAEVRFYRDPCDSTVNKVNYGFSQACKDDFPANTITWIGSGAQGFKVGDETRAAEFVAAGMAGRTYTARPAAFLRNCGRPVS